MNAKHHPNQAKPFRIRHRRERAFNFEQYVVFDRADDKAFDTPDRRVVSLIELRIYGSKASNSCCVWVNAPAMQMHLSSSGEARGYGYDRASAAAENALLNAGFTFDRHWGGSGPEHVAEALLAIATLFGAKAPAHFHCHR